MVHAITLGVQGPSRLVDEAWMRVALDLARQGSGATYPNPCVGAVLVQGEHMLAAAHSDRTGGPHAEARVLAIAGAQAEGATLYVTLEPCAHFGRTPPCADALIAAKIRRVCISVGDPAAHVAGRGIAKLQSAGIEVATGCLAAEGQEVHAHYLHHVATQRPWVSLKLAVSLDGQIACANGQSQWITGPMARRVAHRLRAQHHAVLVGAQTVIDDDPRLNVRDVAGEDPIAIVLDPRASLLRARPQARCLRAGALVVVGAPYEPAARAPFAAAGVETIALPLEADGHFDLGLLLHELGGKMIRSVLVEGGGRLLGSWLRSGLFQELHLFQAPLILGQGRPAFAGVGWQHVDAAPHFRRKSEMRLGPDHYSVFVAADPPT